jgi:hypothetical protein
LLFALFALLELVDDSEAEEATDDDGDTEIDVGFGRFCCCCCCCMDRLSTSAIVLFAADISAFSSTSTVQAFDVGYEILNTLDAGREKKKIIVD